MVDQSALAPSDSLACGCESPMDAAADLWAVMQVAELMPVTPEMSERLSTARIRLNQHLDLLGWDETVLASWIRQNPQRRPPPGSGTGPTLCI